MTRILLFGGHGKVALLLEPILAGRGDTVTAVIRDPAQTAAVASTGATPLTADIETFDTDQLTDLTSGNDVVVWSAGAGGGDPARTYAVDRDAAIRSIDAAAASGVRRYIMVSYFGARPDHGVAADDPFFVYAEAKAAADEHLRRSDLDWTIVAPSGLTLEPGTGRIDATADTSATVARADVAAVIAAVVTDASTVGRTIRFNSGDTPISEALSARVR